MANKSVSVEQYLQTETWCDLQAARLRIDDYTCALCGGTAVLAHHKFDVKPFRETVKDLTSLCAECESNYLHPPTLDLVRRQVHSKRLDPTNVCPVCDQNVVERPHSLYTGQMNALRVLVKLSGTDRKYVDVRAEDNGDLHKLVYRLQGDWAKIAYFGLMEDDGSHRSLWRPTELGLEFLKGAVKIPRLAFMYNMKVVGMSNDDQIFVHEVPDKN